MSFLDSPTEEVLPSRRSQQHRPRVLSDLFKKFRRAFPEVTYELLWESPTINAQVWRLRSAQFVRVYGGYHVAGTAAARSTSGAYEAKPVVRWDGCFPTCNGCAVPLIVQSERIAPTGQRCSCGTALLRD
jgi:hypothetical protein